MVITGKQQEEGTETINWLIQHFGNFVGIITTKLDKANLSKDDPRIKTVLQMLGEGKQKLAAL
jgi:hypothetical protein